MDFKIFSFPGKTMQKQNQKVMNGKLYGGFFRMIYVEREDVEACKYLIYCIWPQIRIAKALRSIHTHLIFVTLEVSNYTSKPNKSFLLKDLPFTGQKWYTHSLILFSGMRLALSHPLFLTLVTLRGVALLELQVEVTVVNSTGAIEQPHQQDPNHP